MRRSNAPVSEALREDVLAGVLPPGTPLIQEELSVRYGVSRIPVREALLRLEADGLAQQEGKRGLVVAALSATEAEDLWMMRVRLEPLALELAFEHISKAVLGQAEDLLDAMDGQDDPAARGRANWEFHRTFYAPSGRQRLLATLEALHLQADRYMRFQFNVIDNRRQSHAEHLAMIAALRAGDLPRACEVLARHIEVAGKQLVRTIRKSMRQGG